MSDYTTVKYALRNFILTKISSLLTSDKVFFATERVTMPAYPYLMITELNNNEDLKSGYEYRNVTTTTAGTSATVHYKDITEYKETTFTVGIYGLSNSDLSTEHDNFRAELNNIRNGFVAAQFSHELKNSFAIKDITDLRPLSEAIDTGFLYRYEFDIRCGYNDIISNTLEQSQHVIIDVDLENVNRIHIEV